jgi:hypothetical protein
VDECTPRERRRVAGRERRVSVYQEAQGFRFCPASLVSDAMLAIIHVEVLMYELSLSRVPIIPIINY